MWILSSCHFVIHCISTVQDREAGPEEDHALCKDGDDGSAVPVRRGGEGGAPATTTRLQWWR
jgi:hypothetical protein